MNETSERKGILKSIHRFPIVWVGAAFASGLIAMFLINYYLNLPSIAPTPDIRLDDKSYTYINPLLECDAGASISTELQSFKSDLQNKINVILASKKADFISVYFRDMNNGPWFGINETEAFSPASLLKVPVMMSYFKAAESNPDLLNTKIAFTKRINPHTEYFTANTIVLGHTYTVEQLINAMIIDSDNDAMDLLIVNAAANDVDLNDVYKYLNVNLLNDGTEITVKQYSTFFRILFNASYLSYDDSEKALSLLAQSTFTQGLKSGVPSSVSVANKFGERWDFSDPEKQLHDCGIVYYPGHPYLLCVMTRGSDFDSMAGVISDISEFVYTQADKQYNTN